jgi:hypothetical protein
MQCPSPQRRGVRGEVLKEAEGYTPDASKTAHTLTACRVNVWAVGVLAVAVPLSSKERG